MGRQHLPGYSKKEVTGRTVSVKKASYIRLLFFHVTFYFFPTSASISSTTDRGGRWGRVVGKEGMSVHEPGKPVFRMSTAHSESDLFGCAIHAGL